MKKYSSYILLLLAGLALGWWLFSPAESTATTEHTHSETSTEQLWTCSMHPQILKTESGDCPICGMELIPAEKGADGLTPEQFTMTENAMALANVQTTVVGDAEDAKGTYTLSGTIQPNEENNAVQVSYFAGRIEKLNVNYTGQTVQKGQVLATMYSPALITAQQELLSAVELKNSQPALYKAVRNKLKLWKLTEAQINSIETSGTVQEYMPVYATVSGTVLDKLVSEGDEVKKGQALLKISNLNTVWAAFDLYENTLGSLEKGQQLSITTAAYPGKTFEGTVAFIDPVLNNTTRTVTARVTLNNKENRWKPGMFVEAKVQTANTTTETLTIPASSVLWTGKRSVVYVKVPGTQPIFEMREVTLGPKLADSYEITSGLTAGEEIVTHGAFTVDAAAQLQGKPSMMHQPKAATENAFSLENEQSLKVAPKFVAQLEEVYKAYLPLKDALVNDDSAKAKASVSQLKSAINAVDMSLLKQSEAHEIWMSTKRELLDQLQQFQQKVDLKEQRKLFIPISENIITLAQTFGATETAYVQFCPMADNNKGAYWLSDETEIKNPYFGASMLTCGNVAKTITSK
ncbi:membrane fusion protein, Cu(I)/Ag(I) efflux system [Pustulibacterium marinum]|uniref:Membrane fusion protein, Cu(I)/Ag(I) efflux system n=1 Tax=Pustulibacterium marinum TaxID=1224947 RepID=A0A1I7H0P2_9FLAO|nr:efflux RND transporter periplasmic adaptor subunit [Pustulibacterium marinum]SFU54253.1 membrane fusion protein, Cu(I)/Ag(I) efflux system [Pustulibacterium marinum]